MPLPKKGRRRSSKGAKESNGGKKEGRKSLQKGNVTKLPPIQVAEAEAQADLLEERRKWIVETNKRENEMRLSKQESLLEQKAKELERLKQKLVGIFPGFLTVFPSASN